MEVRRCWELKALGRKPVCCECGRKITHYLYVYERWRADWWGPFEDNVEEWEKDGKVVADAYLNKGRPYKMCCKCVLKLYE